MKNIIVIILFLVLSKTGFTQEFTNQGNLINYITEDFEVKNTKSNVVTQSSSNLIELLNSLSCNNVDLQFHYENSYYRVFDLFEDFNLNGDCLIDSIMIGIEMAKSGTINKLQPLIVNFYALSKYDGNTINPDSLTQLGESVNVDIHDNETGKLKTINIGSNTVIEVVEGKKLVVEIIMPNGKENHHLLYIGSNSFGQTGKTFIRAPQCGVENPINVEEILFPDMMLILSLYWEYTSPNPAIQSFKIDGQLKDEIIVNDPDYTIDLVMLADAVLTNLVPTISIPAGYYINPPSGLANDFITPVDYTVSNIGSKVSKTWSVIVSNAGPEIISASLVGIQNGTPVIDKDNFMVTIQVPIDTDLSALSPALEVYTGFNINPESGSSQDFSLGSVSYTVSHTSLPLTQVWEVSVEHAAVNVKRIVPKDFKIIPNPSSGIFHISGLKIKKIEVFNISGKSITSVFDSYLDLSAFQSGIYFLKIYSEGQIYLDKVILLK